MGTGASGFVPISCCLFSFIPAMCFVEGCDTKVTCIWWEMLWETEKITKYYMQVAQWTRWHEFAKILHAFNFSFSLAKINLFLIRVLPRKIHFWMDWLAWAVTYLSRFRSRSWVNWLQHKNPIVPLHFSSYFLFGSIFTLIPWEFIGSLRGLGGCRGILLF